MREPVGTVNISAIDRGTRRCEWGLYLGEESARGTGAALGASVLSLDLAFGTHGISVAECEVKPDNDRAIVLYERLGFRRAGRRQAGGTELDLYEMSGQDWATARPVGSSRLSVSVSTTKRGSSAARAGAANVGADIRAI